ncbi:tryptophan halogenase family protein [Pseudocolwellia agarivorans]|uniref:tryptophan halogenase family protein n=1 Tax=Pseudocolwellia agarivorans TaxID=1911682 RepID=UPI000987A1ED|nr:tryptophan halogenase family protein [Pseudocolwellia agarivorans]
MQKNENIKNYVIVGGGTAGWISAAILARTLHNTEHTITVIESPNIPTIGVGEATIPSIVDMLEFLRIPLKDFILKTNATFKLGIKFVDWKEKNHHYWHQFGHIGNKVDAQPFYQHWLKHQFINPTFELTDFSPAIALAKQNKFFIPDPKQPSNLSKSAYALHFDASLVAKYLTEYSTALNVKLIQAHVKDTLLDENGNISQLTIDGHESIKGDFFIDCTGQSALLINKALRVGYENWQHYLPVNKAVAAQSELITPLSPYTESIAHEHGWRWRIPLQNRTGNGYVYCSDYCSDDEAIGLLKKNVPNIITEPRVISFTTGKRNKVWHKNCLAVGLSSGFLEPLESTSIYLIMKTMLNFVQSLPTKEMAEPTINEFNRLIDNEYYNIRDFIILHYCETKRTDSKFWQMWQNLAIPESLKTKLDLFKCQGRLYENHYDLFASESWYAVLEGMGVRPKSYDPIIDKSLFDKIEKAFTESAKALQINASKTLDHAEYINRLKH